MEILPEHVRPGDLITADFMNRTLDRIDALEDRVDALEADGTDDGSVAITQLIPSGGAGDPIRIGQELRILGRHFGFSVGGHRVYFDGTLITAYKPGSSDNLLVVDVPSLPDLPPGGETVTLRVTNGSTFDTRTITVHPVEQTLFGDVDVLWRNDLAPNPDPNPIPNVSETGPVDVTFAYRLRSRASQPAIFSINPTISVSEWQDSLRVLDSERDVISDRRIQLDPDEEASFFVRVMLIPTGTSITPFSLNVVSTAGTVEGASMRRFEVGTPVEEGDPAITLAFTDAIVFKVESGAPDSSGGSFDETTNTISVARGFRLYMSFAATFEQAAVYAVTVEGGPGTADWDLQVRTPNTGTYDETGQDVPVNEDPEFSVEPKADASASGEATFRIRRQGESRSQTRTFTLALLPS